MQIALREWLVNWDAIGAIAELVGAAAVIVSIAYLGVQVRQTRLQLQSQAEDYIASRTFDAYDPVYEGDHAHTFRKGLESPEQLDEDEAFVFRLLMDRQRGAFATIVHRHRSGAISAAMADRLLASYKQLFLQTAGGKHWLEYSWDVLSDAEQRALK